MWPSKVKVIAGISVILLLAATYAYSSDNQRYLFLISAVSSLIQIVLFVVWYFEENPITQETVNQVEQIYMFTQNEQARHSRREDFIKLLLENGVIEEQELRAILSKIQNEDVLLVHTYGEGMPKTLKTEMGLKSGPAIDILTKLGFVRVFRLHNLFLISIKDLPPAIRSVHNLEKFLNSEIEKAWKCIQEKIIEKYPASKYKMLEKWRSGTGYAVSYIISKVPRNDVITGFKNSWSFTHEFVAVIASRVKPGWALPHIRNTIKVKELVKNASVELFLTDFPRSLKEKILENENSFKAALGLKLITDLRNIPTEKITVKLHELDPSQDECDKYSRELIAASKEFYELLADLGVSDL